MFACGGAPLRGTRLRRSDRLQCSATKGPLPKLAGGDISLCTRAYSTVAGARTVLVLPPGELEFKRQPEFKRQ